MKRKNTFFANCKAAYWLLFIIALAPSAFAGSGLLNINFSGYYNSVKTGVAAVGLGSGDIWNRYVRDPVPGDFQYSGQLPNLQWSDGTSSGMGLNVTNAAGAWANGSSDAMFESYLYPLSPGDLTISVTNLPSGTYTFYVYGHGQPDDENGVYTLTTGGNEIGPLATSFASGWNTLNWTDGIQYVAFKNVTVQAGATVTITASAGNSGKPLVNGIQILDSGLFTAVIPSGLQGDDGNYYAGTLYSPGMRSQVVYGANNFPPGPLTITELRFRRDKNEPPVSNASASVTLKLSTTLKNPGGLSTTFADNSGADEVTVFNGTWTYSSQTTLAPGVVRPFDIVLPLTTPFTYDPSAGNLLFDIRTASNDGNVWTDGVNSSQLSRVQASFSPDAATGSTEQTGDVIQIVYNLDGAPGLSFSPDGGTFTNSVKVTIQSPIGSGTVRYTTDGSDPSETSSAYSGALTLTDTMTVKARLYVNGYPASDVVEATYTLYTPPDIQFNPPGQLFTNQISVALINNVGSGVIRYTTDGSAPTATSTSYGSAINLTAGATIKAQVYVNSFPVSAVFSETYSRVYVFESDGIPFSWLEQYFGANYLTNPDAAANADSDHDGYTNLEEYQNGTVPTDGSSAPEIVLTVKTVPRLTFTTLAGRSYRIDRTTTLNPPDWQTIVESVMADGSELHYVDEDAPDNSYYRIQLISP